MLCQLSIQNIALIKKMTVSFAEGFCVLTGETGAGKSILVDAMNLALGERADKELIRTGSDKAQVEALFDVGQNPRVLAILQELGIEDEDGQLLIARELSSAGRSIVRINGTMQPLSALRKLTEQIVDLHGQHEHQSLLNEVRHGALLDGFAAQEITPVQRRVAQRYAAYRDAIKQLRALTGGDERERAMQSDLLDYQIKELTAAKLREGEEEELRQERERLRHQEEIARALGSAHIALSGDEETSGAVDALSATAAALRGIATYAPEYAELATRLEDIVYTVEDIAGEIASLDDDDDEGDYQNRLDEVGQRLDTLRSLKKKYGDDVPQMLAYLEKVSMEREHLLHGAERAKELEGGLKKQAGELLADCDTLAQVRSAAAERFGEQVRTQLHDLGMPKAAFAIEVQLPAPEERMESITANGYDRVRFLFSANSGEPPKPLARIASGGEMSRVMLALKSVSAGEIGCLIFDEIDTGISGRMAQVVGEKIAKLAHDRQIICVTHLPQIACMADTQYSVYKTEEEGRAGTSVKALDEAGRIGEIARLVGGADGEEAAKEHAASMLRAAQDKKRTLS